METDAQFYEMFRLHPEWIADLMNNPFPEPARFESVTIKRLERRVDGLVIPKNVRRPLLLVEFQFWAHRDIYLRTVEGWCGVQREHPKRRVESVIFFGRRGLDPRTEPWCGIVRAVYLDEEMIILAQRHPQHPLPGILSPVFENDAEKLERKARTVYESLGRTPGYTREQREQFQTLFTSLVVSRFRNKTAEEIATMLKIPDLTTTRAGRSLFARGKAEGKAEGMAEGKAEGKAAGRSEGKLGTLMHILEKRFGRLPAGLRSGLEKLDYLGLERLEDCVLDFPDLTSAETWVRRAAARKKPSVKNLPD
ncbi:MAG: DUF2887 domain-containing protein [Verrucomicrobiales bacterium]|nr:DUF2887 domain-containing protein [Verrucomicrobiales bacterium]